MKIAIVTGASSGIGAEFVKQISAGITSIEEIWVIARRKQRLEALAKAAETRVKILPLDMTSPDFIETLETLLKLEQPDIKMLVNAAGFGKIGTFETIPLQEQTDMIGLNCQALTEMTYLCLPYLSKKGRIIQMASAAAFVPQPTFAVYAASKAYVLSFTRAINRELTNRNITMTAVCPGPVETEFFDVAEQTGQTSDIKKFFRAKPGKVVRQALMDSAARKEMSVCGIPMKAFQVLCKLLPHKVVLAVMDRLF